MNTKAIILGIAAVAAGCAVAAVPACDLPRGSRRLWDVKALGVPPRTFPVTVPCSNDYGRIQGVEPIFVEGEPWKGQPTRVFAWWGLPKGARADCKVPGIVLVHGGGGTAFAKWVKTWNDRGYAAIAMDTCGGIPQGERDGKPHPRHEWSGPSGWGSSVAQIGDPIRDQWTYHAVAAVMRCHSFLRARPEVDASRIGLTGISWGGYLSSIVGSVDGRFRFAAPVYGCGFYELNPAWHTMGGGGEKLRAWYALWDAKNFYDSPDAGVGVPYLWCCGTNDRWYPLDTVRKSCNMLDRTVPLNLSLKLNMPHAHPPAGDPKEITAMANAICKDGKPLVDVTHAWLEKGGVLRAEFDAHGRTVARAELLCTCDPNPLLMKRKWQVAEVKDLDKSGRLSVSVPEDAVMFFVNLVDSEGLVASSRIFERADWGLVDHPRNPATDWMVGGCGAFAHYLVGKDMFDRIGEFDVQGLVKQIVDIKPDWFCITLGQNSGYMCSPNETYERICGYAPGSHCSTRDIPAELIAALKPTGIKVMLYLPCQTPNRDVHAVKSFGFPEEKANHDRMINVEAARRWGQVIEEWSRRYGKDVAGWWFDGGYHHIRFNDEIAEIYAAAAKRGNPEAVVAFNEGVRAPVKPWTFAGDYLAGEINEPFKETCAGRWMDDRQWHVLTFAGSFWGRTDCRYEDRQWIDWMKPILKNGGAVTIDLAIDRPTGRLNDAQAAQLKRVFKACCLAGACGAAYAEGVVETGKVFGAPRKVTGTSSRIMATCLEGNRLYAGGGPDFYVFDVAEPLKPKLLGHVDGLVGVRQIAVRNGMAYVSAREAGLWIIDATDPARPRVRSRFDCCELATGVDVAGDVVFLGQRQNGVEFIDVSDPDHPAHIAMRKTDESQSVKYRNGYVYSGDWGSGKLTVFDARDMKNIRQVAYEDLWGFGDGVWLKGKYLYAATGHHAKHRDPATLPFKGVDSETLHLYGGAGRGAGCGHGLDIFDVSDPTHPKRVGRADYPPFYERGFDMWTPRTSANSDLVFCADTHNGLFAVDCADPANPNVVDRWTSPASGHPEWPSWCVGSVSVGNGCVYAGGMGSGLVVIPAKGAAQETFVQGPPPANASFREPYPTDDAEFWVWKPSKPGQARAVAVAGDVVYAACGDAGLHVLKVRPEGGFEKIGELAGHPRVFDVQVDGTRLYTAEGLDGFGFYEMDGPTGFREIGRLPQIGPGNNVSLCVWVADRDHLVLSSRNGGCRFFDISDLAHPKDLFRFGSCPGWDKYMMDAPIGGGRYIAYNNAHKNIAWFDLKARPAPCPATTTKYNFISLSNGLCKFSDDQALVTVKAGYALLAPNQGDPADHSRWQVKELPGPKMNGIPRKDPDGPRVVKTCRIDREVALYDFADPEKPELVKYWKVSGNPDIAQFHKGKVVIPCGHQGVLLQK